MRNSIDRADVVRFCRTPRITKDIMVKFNLIESQVNKMMKQLIVDGTIVMQKKLMNKSLRNIYVSHATAKKFDVTTQPKVVYDFNDLPAHDPFGLAKGARNARRH